MRDNIYDQIVMDDIMLEAGCRPPHWKATHNLSLCSNPDQMAYFYDQPLPAGIEEFGPPCTVIENLQYRYHEQEYSNKEFSTNESYFVFRVAHRQTQFKEIKQIRAYDPESLYGDIGGYMGLLLGYSILNLPSMIAVCYGFIKNRFSNQKQLRQNRQKAGKIDAWLLSDHLNTMVRTETINIDKTIVENVEKRHEKLTEINTDSDLIIENCIGD